jgi:transcriptional regulator with XRE-family HTH domain
MDRNVGQRLNAVREELGRSINGMSKLLGISRDVWSNWVKGRNWPDEEAMLFLCEKYGLTMDWIYRGQITSGVPLELALRLEARLDGKDPDKEAAALLAHPRGRAGSLASAAGARKPRR